MNYDREVWDAEKLYNYVCARCGWASYEHEWGKCERCGGHMEDVRENNKNGGCEWETG